MASIPRSASRFTSSTVSASTPAPCWRSSPSGRGAGLPGLAARIPSATALVASWSGPVGSSMVKFSTYCGGGLGSDWSGGCGWSVGCAMNARGATCGGPRCGRLTDRSRRGVSVETTTCRVPSDSSSPSRPATVSRPISVQGCSPVLESSSASADGVSGNPDGSPVTSVGGLLTQAPASVSAPAGWSVNHHSRFPVNTVPAGSTAISASAPNSRASVPCAAPSPVTVICTAVVIPSGSATLPR